MSDYYPPSQTQPSYEPTQAMPAQDSSSMADSMTEAMPDSVTDKANEVKDRAAEVKDQATQAAAEGKQAAGQVAQTAVEQAQEVKDEAVRQARDLAGEARQQVTSQVGQQHKALVSNLRSLGSELGSMQQSADGQSGVATELVGQAKDRLDGLADWLDGREPGQLLDEVRNYARRRPGMFLVGALAAGVVAGRLTRGVVASHTADDSTAALGGSAQQSVSYGDGGESAAASGYSTGGQYGADQRQVGYPAVPESTQGYGSTSTYGDNGGSQYGAPAYGQPQQVQPAQDLPNGGTWR
jgi:vacuolar-type H+-ATPase subunit H